MPDRIDGSGFNLRKSTFEMTWLSFLIAQTIITFESYANNLHSTRENSSSTKHKLWIYHSLIKVKTFHVKHAQLTGIEYYSPTNPQTFEQNSRSIDPDNSDSILLILKFNRAIPYNRIVLLMPQMLNPRTINGTFHEQKSPRNRGH